jgi:Putative Ig domain
VSPALPAGLSLSSSNGDITGTPTAAAPAATYVVTAANAGGKATVSLTLVVAAGPLLDVGHNTQLSYARMVGSVLLTQDRSTHWVLWDYPTGENIASGAEGYFGAPYYPIDLERSAFVIETPAGLEVRSTTDGTQTGLIPVIPSWWLLASDGSYVVTGSDKALTVYSPTGTTLFTHTGNYNSAVAYAAPGQVQVALGAAGSSAIETIAVPSGTSTVGAAFQGTFSSWFTDGSRFLTATGTTVWVYSSASVQEDLASLPTVLGLTGIGNWYYTVAENGQVSFYAVGSAGASPYTQSVASVGGMVVPSGSTVGLLTLGLFGVGRVTVVDLAGATPSSQTVTAPINELTAYAAASSAAWIVGNVGGVIYDGASTPSQPRYLDYGQVTSITGSTSRIAIATASGRILYYSAATNALEGTINTPASTVQLSTDGSVLAAATAGHWLDPDFYYLGADVIDVYALPAGTLTASYSSQPYGTSAGPSFASMTLSGSGAVLGEQFVGSATAPCFAQTVAISNGATLWCGTGGATLVLSSDGTGVAEVTAPNSSNVYVNATLTTAVPGNVAGWLTPTTMLVNDSTYDANNMLYDFTGTVIYNTSGTVVQSTPLPNTGTVQPLSSTSVYSGYINAIYSVNSTTATWASGSQLYVNSAYYYVTSPGAVAGSEVVFLDAISPNFVLAEPHQ